VVKSLAFAVPGDLATPTGGYAYDRRMIAELKHLGWQIDVVDLGDGFPWPDSARAQAALTLLAAVPAGRAIVIDGLALGVLPQATVQLGSRNPLVALVHHPLAMESGLTAQQAEAMRASERSALAAVRCVVVTSAATARQLVADYDVPASRMTVAQPGNDPVPMSQGSQDGIVCLLSVGAVVRRKGFDVLIEALATLTDLPWRLTIAGDRTRDSKAVRELDADISRFKLGDRIAVLGAVPDERLAELYAAADLFVLASRFEGYGMAYAEAIAHGLPVIGTTAGAIPDTVPADAGILVAPDNVGALAIALHAAIENRHSYLPPHARRRANSRPGKLPL